MNVPPRTDWFDPEPNGEVPQPLTTDQLIPRGVQEQVAKHGRKVAQAYRRAVGPQGWRMARGLRPPPLELSEQQAMHPIGRGWCWVQGDDALWRPLTRSSWPSDPPESDLNTKAVLLVADADFKRFGPDDKPFIDRFVIACMAHGFPAPELERAVVLGFPHVGALKEVESVAKCMIKDRKQDNIPGKQPWTVHGSAMPRVWPTRVDPINIVLRNGKARMTIDKSMRLSLNYASYNESVDLTEYDAIEMVRVEQLARATAILLTAGVGVRVWSFDLEAYFRKSGKQRADWWKSGMLLPDGFAYDKRIQFGQREAPVLTSRQSRTL